MTFTIKQLQPTTLGPGNFMDYPQPTITALEGGGWIAAWHHQADANDPGGVFVSVFAPDGSLMQKPGGGVVADKLEVSTPGGTGRELLPSLAALPGGGWVVVWRENDADGRGIVRHSVYGPDGQLATDANGIPIADKAALTPPDATDSLPAVTALEGGGWAVTWQTYFPANGNTSEIYQSVFGPDGQLKTDANGITIADRELVSDANPGEERPQMVALDTGGWVVVWSSRDGATGKFDLYQRVYGANGETVLDRTLVSGAASDQWSVSVVALKDGGYVVAWDTDETGLAFDIRQSVYNSDGTLRTKPGGADFVAHEAVVSEALNEQWYPSVAALDDGGWVVVWQSTESGEWGIYQSVYAADGTRVINNELVSLVPEEQMFPRVTGLPGGGWVVTWESRLDTVPDANHLPDPVVYQRVYGRFTAGADHVIGDAAGNNTLVIDTATPISGDILDGGAGMDDALEIDGAGTISFAGVTVSNFESLIGVLANGPRTIILDQYNFGGFDNIWSAGQDRLVLTGGTFDFTTTDVANVSAIEVSAAATLTFDGLSSDDIALAKLVDPKLLQGGQVTIEFKGAAPSAADIALILKKGVAKIEMPDGSGGVTVVENKAPVITYSGASAIGIDENTTKVATLSAADPEGATVTYSVTGANAALFEIRNGSELHFKAAPDYEQWAKTKVPYAVTVVASDEVSTDTQAFTVSVKNVDEAPYTLIASGGTIAENAKKGTVALTIQAVDPDGDKTTLKLLPHTGNAFSLDGSKLVVNNPLALDFEKGATRTVKVTVSDDGGKTFTERAITINLTDVVNETITGTNSGQTISGAGGNDKLIGLGGNDALYGGAGNDRLYGGLGRDSLHGGLGQDKFVFNTKPSSTAIDRIKDFSVPDDSIWLDNAVFRKLGSGSTAAPGKLKAGFFKTGSAAADANDYLVYNRKTGALLYDADGNGAGAAVQVATLAVNLKLTAADFFVI